MDATGGGFYRRRIFPWINDKVSADPVLERIRAGAVQGARGRVVEIGFGSGLNMPHYGSAVTELVAVEPNPGMVDRAAQRIANASYRVQVVPAAAERLPLDDASFDTAVSTLTLCSVAEPQSVLRELRRVLRDDGHLLLLEHGLARDEGVARWQNRLDWLQGKVACGCHLNRPIERLLEDAGFRFARIEQYFAPGMPRTHGWVTIADAMKAQ